MICVNQVYFLQGLGNMFEEFLKYQNGEVHEYPSYAHALYEITIHKKKMSHWIWYIVPYDLPCKQHKDLFVLNEKGVSFYLQNEQLRTNYIEIMNEIYKVLTKVKLEEYEDVMSRIDLKKVYRSALLFKKECPSSDEDTINVCARIIHLLKDYVEQREKEDLERKVLFRFIQNVKPI